MSQKEITALGVNKVYADIFALAADISEGDVIIKKNCKLCNSNHRAAAEQYWLEKKKNVAAVVRYLEDLKESITYKAVENHLEEHFWQQQRMLAVKNYVGKLQLYSTVKNDKLATITLMRASLIKELLDIGEQGDSLPLCERRKNADMIAKLSASILACDEQERKHNEEWKPARIIVEKLQQIIQVQMTDADENSKTVLAKVIENLFDDMEGIKFDR